MAIGNKEPEEKQKDSKGIKRPLRVDAEEQLACSPKSSPDPAWQTPEQLIHELHVHQVELGTQAEELRKARLELEDPRDRYLGLCEFGPVGYLSLTDKALIADVNITGIAIKEAGEPGKGARFERTVPEGMYRYPDLMEHGNAGGMNGNA